MVRDRYVCLETEEINFNEGSSPYLRINMNNLNSERRKKTTSEDKTLDRRAWAEIRTCLTYRNHTRNED